MWKKHGPVLLGASWCETTSIFKCWNADYLQFHPPILTQTWSGFIEAMSSRKLLSKLDLLKKSTGKSLKIRQMTKSNVQISRNDWFMLSYVDFSRVGGIGSSTRFQGPQVWDTSTSCFSTGATLESKSIFPEANMRYQSGRKLGPLNSRGCGSNHLPGTQFPDLIWWVVEPTPSETYSSKWIISPRIGVKIPEIFELPPPSDFKNAPRLSSFFGGSSSLTLPNHPP